MTISSMTGYGRAVLVQGHNRYVVEARSLNNRYCEVRVFGKQDEYQLEFEISKLVKQMFHRGKFDVSLRKETIQSEKKAFDTKKLQNHFAELKKVHKALGMKDEITLETVLKTAPGNTSESVSVEDMTAMFMKTSTEALKSLEKSRHKEGKVLSDDIKSRLKTIDKSFTTIQNTINKIRESKKQEIRQRIHKVIQDLPIDGKRIETEVALMIERSDVSEELVRFRSHLASFENILFGSKYACQSIGKELDFTIQELNREINTLGAKINDTDISMVVVVIKAEIEKVREQVQNIE